MSAYLPHAARIRTWLALSDTVGLGFAVWLAFQVRFDPRIRELKWEQLLLHPWILLFALVAAIALAAAAELYEPEVLHRRVEVSVRVVVMVAAWAMTIILAAYLQPDWDYGRGLMALTSLFWGFCAIFARWTLTSWIRQGSSRFPALVVGDATSVRRFCRELRSRDSAPWRPVDGSDLDKDEIANAIDVNQAAIVVFASSDERTLRMGRDLAGLHFSGVPVVSSSEVWAWLEERLPLEALTPNFFLHQPGFGAVHWTLFNRLTRITDILLASLLLVLTAPLFLLGALLVLVTDGRPVLYMQSRVGQFGRHFTMLKLRTMRRDAESAGPSFSKKDDPRTLPVGHFLRRFRIDELPQLLNVLKGEMSMVGPRPERPEFVAELTQDIPYYAFRTAVPPGLTGWAQVNVPYAADLDDHRRKLEYDLYFIRERSTRLYMLTLLRTVSAALVGVRS